MKDRSGQQRGDGGRLRKRIGVEFISLLQMIGARCAQLSGEARCAGVRELFRMNFQLEPQVTRASQITARLVESESATVAVDIGEYGEPLPADARHHLGAHPVDIAVGILYVLRRDEMRAQIGRHNIQRLAIDGRHHHECLQFAGFVESIAGLCFDGRGAVPRKLANGSQWNSGSVVGHFPKSAVATPPVLPRDSIGGPIVG